jgi:hypothetical protein
MILGCWRCSNGAKAEQVILRFGAFIARFSEHVEQWSKISTSPYVCARMRACALPVYLSPLLHLLRKERVTL